MGCTEQLCEIKKWAIALEKMGVADQMYEFWQRDVALQRLYIGFEITHSSFSYLISATPKNDCGFNSSNSKLILITD